VYGRHWDLIPRLDGIVSDHRRDTAMALELGASEHGAGPRVFVPATGPRGIEPDAHLYGTFEPLRYVAWRRLVRLGIE
jgi:hypothetical protein